ncbi:MAG TPA: SDR family oxidoreductase [Ilumatobacteraceae bacterium]|nr:SDR family oxidoreductase [Ilumatobacteraceae bacterium]
MSAETPLDGKVAVVTGASRGIGHAAAVRLAELGCDVVVAARTVEPRPDLAGSITQTAEQVRALGRRCLPVAADMTSDADIANLAAATLAEFGRVDILINNAAALDERMYESFWDMTPESWRYQVELNLTSPWMTLKAFAPAMREQGGGLVVNMTSALASAPLNPNLPGHGSTGAAYTTTKSALSRLTSDLSKELVPHGISIVALHPGFVKTDNGERLAPVGGFDMSKASGSTDAPMAALSHLVTNDPVQWSGTVVFAPQFANDLGLLDG